MKIQKSLIITSLISLLLFIAITLNVLTKGILVQLDSAINLSILSIQNSLGINIFKIIGIIFDTWTLLGITIICSIYLWIKDSKKDSIFFTLVMIITAVLVFILKEIFQRARPLDILINESSSSFPSGHAVVSVVFFGILAYLIFIRQRSKTEKIVAWIITILLMLIIGFSRIYLNAHWLSDILAGYCLGIFILITAILKRKWILRKKII